MKISETFPDEIYTTRWRLNMAKGVFGVNKEKSRGGGAT